MSADLLRLATQCGLKGTDAESIVESMLEQDGLFMDATVQEELRIALAVITDSSEKSAEE